MLFVGFYFDFRGLSIWLIKVKFKLHALGEERHSCKQNILRQYAICWKYIVRQSYFLQMKADYFIYSAFGRIHYFYSFFLFFRIIDVLLIEVFSSSLGVPFILKTQIFQWRYWIRFWLTFKNLINYSVTTMKQHKIFHCISALNIP